MVSLRPRRQTGPAADDRPQLVASGLLVPAYYGAQVRRRFESDAAAVEHYLTTGRAEGMLPNPVHDLDRVAAHDLPDGADDVVARSAAWPVRESFDRSGYRRLLPASALHPGGPAGHFLQAQADGGTPFGLRDPAGHVQPWAEVLRVAAERGKHLRRVLEAEVLDRELYEAQVGRTFASDAAAVWHYLERGEHEGLSPTSRYAVPAAPPVDLDDAVSRFARAVRNKELTEPSPAPVRARMLDELRTRVVPPAPPERPWTPPRVTAAPPSPLTVSLLARAADLTREGVREIASLTAQTHEAWELVVALHPRAPGRVRGRLSRLAAADDRVRVVEVDDALATTQVLVDVAEGEVIGWWDGSRLHPDLMAQALAALETGEGEPDVASAGVVHGDDLGNADPLRRVDPPLSFDSLMTHGPRSVRGVLARRATAAIAADPLDGPAAGWEWLIEAAAHAPIAAVPLIGVAGGDETFDVPTLARLHDLVTGYTGAGLRKGTTTVVVPGVDRIATLVETLRVALDDGADEAVVVVDRTAHVVPLLAGLGAAGVDAQAVRIAHLPAPGPLGLAIQQADHAASGETYVLLSPSVVLVPGAIDRLTAGLADDVVAVTAVVLADDDTIVSAGVVADGRGSTPRRFLAGHPSQDAARLDGVPFATAEGHAVALESLALSDHSVDPGLDEWAVVDVLVRAANGRRVQVADDVRLHLDRAALPALDPATAPWAPAEALPPAALLDRATGLVTAGWSDAPDRSTAPVLVRTAPLVGDGPARGLPALRWALKLPTPPGPRGPLWGDTFFAHDLARSLRRLGQEVVTDRRTAHHRASGHLDDVVLSLRGLERYRPQPGATSILWVISHPDLVDPDELREVDLAYAASAPWAHHATEASGRPVAPLLQAADTSRFHPLAHDAGSREGILFVGRPRRGRRRVVTDAIAAGATLELYGEGWADVVDERHVRDEFVPNDRLPDLYRRARIVLNDHWPDMAAEGFWSNRTFEAVASGALVVSDDVAGGTAPFGGLVRGYADLDELGSLLAPASPGWPAEADRPALVERFGRDHGFDARARALLADVLDHRGVPHDLNPGAS